MHCNACRLSECAMVVVLPTVSIRNTNSAAAETTYWAAWQDMRDFEHIYAKLQVGATFNAADNVTTCKLQQATSAAGAGAKDLTTSASGGDYDTDNPVDAAGNTVVLEARKADLDVTNGFRYVRLYAASTDNTGVDNVEGVLVLHCANEKYAQKEAAAAVGEVVYGKA
jgi:hypothetical protein